MALNLSHAQKVIAIIAGSVAILSAMGKGLDMYVSSLARAAAAPVANELRVHEALPGHPETVQELEHMHGDLEYIRGRIDEKWGKVK